MTNVLYYIYLVVYLLLNRIIKINDTGFKPLLYLQWLF
nr:MAG TPA_asm: hypothetical protein [Caudoviricetes sp.]